ncbi:ATP-binding protein [Kitasatospora purpeofusca]|uniref:ATP-binding protein n=1 Tax=Kitasatospora purpeofusca TaxID=67352 RepID=UPI002E14FF3E|nr:ATP-binding protein [Kitasatospora purpeofusca]WSR37901.1 ATP-binding protein [Kitasatospora purpeofusca]
MTAEAPAASARRSCAWDLPHDPRSVALARHALRSELGGWGFSPDHIDQAELVLDELLTNAVEHARPPLCVRLHCPLTRPVVRIEVADGGPSAHDGPWTTSCAPDEHGRGCLIVAALSCAHGEGPHGEGGAVHWADLLLEDPAAPPAPRRHG